MKGTYFSVTPRPATPTWCPASCVALRCGRVRLSQRRCRSSPMIVAAATPSSRPGPQSGSLLASLFAVFSSLPGTVCGRTSCAAGTEWGGTRSPARGRTSPAWRSSSSSTSSARRRPCGPKLRSYQKAKDRDENRTEEEERQ